MDHLVNRADSGTARQAATSSEAVAVADLPPAQGPGPTEGIGGLLRASLLSWASASALVVAGVVRGKVLATSLGPAGVGTLAQLAAFANVAGLVGSLSLGSGIAQFIAKFRRDGDTANERRLVQSVIVMTAAASLVLAAIVMVAAVPLSAYLFDGNRGLAPFIRLLAVGALFMAVTPNLQSIFSGYGAVRLSSATEIATAAATIALTIALVIPFGLGGAVLALALTPAVRVCSQLALIGRHVPGMLARFPRALDGPAVKRVVSGLLAIGAATMVMAVGDGCAQLFVRTRIVHLFGVATNGLYQAAVGASTQLLVAATGFVSAYAYAAVNRGRTSQARSASTNQAFHLTLVVVGVGSAALILFRDAYLRLLLSHAFLPARPYVAVQATGEVFKQLGLAVGLGVLLHAGVRPWMGLGLIWGVAPPLLTLLLPLGRWAVPLPYALTAVVYFGASWLVAARYDDFRMTRANVVSLATMLAMLLVLSLLPARAMATAAGALLTAAWAATALAVAPELRAAVLSRWRRWRGPVGPTDQGV